MMGLESSDYRSHLTAFVSEEESQMRGCQRPNTTIVVEARGTNHSIFGHVRNKMQICFSLACRNAHCDTPRIAAGMKNVQLPEDWLNQTGEWNLLPISRKVP